MLLQYLSDEEVFGLKPLLFVEDSRFIAAVLCSALVTDLPDQFVLVSLYIQVSRIEHLAGVFFHFVVIVVKPLENDYQIFRKLSYLHIN